MKKVSVLLLFASLVCATPVAHAVEADPISPGSWTMVLLPDTQHYVDGTSPAGTFAAQTQWIADHKASHNIQMVLHLGDITNNKTTAEFTTAKAAMDTLRTAGVPYSMAPGNHDYTLSSTTRSTLFNDNAYFGPTSTYGTQTHFQAQGSEGSRFFESGKTDNSYCTFNAGGEDWLVFSVEYGPRDTVIGWMDSVATAHPNHNLILNTHAYLYYDDTRYDWDLYGSAQSWNPRATTIYGGSNDGQDLWDELVKKHENWKFTFNGHVLEDGAGRLSSIGTNGNVVHQMLSNYQMRTDGGDGYMRILEFMDDGDTVKVSTYSPYSDAYFPYLTAYDQQFTLKMSEPMPPTPVIRGVSCASLNVTTGTTNATSVWSIPGTGPGSVELLSEPNIADVSVMIDKTPTYRQQGVMLATVRQNSRDGYYGTVEVSQENLFAEIDNNVLQIATSRAYTSGEYNVNVAAALFPFADAWIAGHVQSDGSLLEHYGVSAGNVSQTGTGRYKVTIDNMDSLDDGMLFIVGGNNGHNNLATAPMADGSGWEVAIRDNTATTFSALESARWSFVYVDYDAPGLIGGRISSSGSIVDSAGSFSLSHPSTGVYRLTVTGYTPDEGMLLLNIAEYETDGITTPDDNIISYENDGNTFLINVRDRNGTATTLENGAFIFAFVAFDNALLPAVLGDANYDGVVDAADVSIMAANWGAENATWAMGDFNVDGTIDQDDAKILAQNWGTGSGESNAVPEPSTLIMLLSLLGLTVLRRRHE